MSHSERLRPTAAHCGPATLGHDGQTTAAHRGPPTVGRGRATVVGHSPEHTTNGHDTDTAGHSHTPNESKKESPAPATLDAALAAVVLTLHLGNPRWMRHAACKTSTGLDWHTDTQRRGRETRAAVEAMKATCATCPVLDACTTWTLDDTYTDRLPGVVAGLDITERRSRRRTAASLRRTNATATKGRNHAPS
jgi:hypothetical protein